MEDQRCLEREGSKKIIAALLLALGLLGSAYLISQTRASVPNVYVSSSSAPLGNSVSVTGNALKTVSPDLLLIDIRVSTLSSSAKTSQMDNANVVTNLKAKLKNTGLSDSDIKTTYYQVEPVYKSVYNCPDRGSSERCYYDSVLDGYKTTHKIQLRVLDLAKGGELIDSAASTGINQTFVEGIQFTLKEETRASIETELLSKASTDTREKSQKIASGAGASLGKVLSLSQGYSYSPSSNYYTRSAISIAETAAPAAQTDVSSGIIQVSATVSAQYEIK